MQNSSSPYPAPSLKRRLICLVYETFLVIAVAALGMFVVLFAAQSMHLAVTDLGRSATLILVTGAYFIHAWTGSGHTLAMKTWRIKIVMVGYARVPLLAALLRYVLAWGWVMPALVLSYRLHLSHVEIGVALVANIIGWSMTALLDKDRQFLHDKLARTRLISLPSPAKKTPAAK